MRAARGAPTRELHQLARLHGVQSTYVDAWHRRRLASETALVSALRALGAPVERAADAPDALRERRQALWRRTTDPVAVGWEGDPPIVKIRAPAARSDRRLSGLLRFERGETQTLRCDLADLPTSEATDIEGSRYVEKALVLSRRLPLGYHRLEIEELGSSTLVIAAPRLAPGAEASRGWGLFLPLYALRSGRSLGVGDLTDLQTLMAWVAELGGRFVATLPLLPAFLDEPFDPSPYAPVSRLFWNELFVDVTSVPELERCAEARGNLESPATRSFAMALGNQELLDHRAVMALKRSVLEQLARCFFDGSSGRDAEFRTFVESRPELEEYARFRAMTERRRAPWPRWSPPDRDQPIASDEIDPEAVRYHQYVQWVAHEQMASVRAAGRALGVGLHLDLPLGVSPEGFDVWRERDVFALGATVGAPPDALAGGGQDWGIPPMHPDRIRLQGYRYPIACIRHLLGCASAVRIDHVMGLHRLFWIPQGLEARQGVYVRYPAEELYAVLVLEAHRRGAVLVGEDLGTVPPVVRPTMARHNVRRTYILQYELPEHTGKPPSPVPAAAFAGLNTHDMPPFAAFWDALDPERRSTIESLSPDDARGTTRLDGRAALRSALGFLAAGPAHSVVVNLEDLWQETRPQNVPGGGDGFPSWRRRARHPFEVFRRMPEVLDTLRSVNERRARR